jgi:hypothetical protein
MFLTKWNMENTIINKKRFINDRAIKRFALFDLLKSLYSDTNISTIFGDVNVKNIFTSHIDKNIIDIFNFFILYIFTIWKCIAYNRFCRDGIYFDKILVSEYKLFKRSNKANLSSNYSDFLKRHLHLRNRLLDQGY